LNETLEKLDAITSSDRPQLQQFFQQANEYAESKLKELSARKKFVLRVSGLRNKKLSQLKILLFGHSGAGKSTLLKTLTGDPTIETSHTTPVNIANGYQKYDIGAIAFIDTVGVNHGDDDVAKFNSLIAKLKKDDLPNVVIYVWNGTTRWAGDEKGNDMCLGVINCILKLGIPCVHLTTNIHKESKLKRANILAERDKRLSDAKYKNILKFDANTAVDFDAEDKPFPVRGVVEMIQSVLDTLPKELGFTLLSTMNVELSQAIKSHWYVKFFHWLLWGETAETELDKLKSSEAAKDTESKSPRSQSQSQSSSSSSASSSPSSPAPVEMSTQSELSNRTRTASSQFSLNGTND